MLSLDSKKRDPVFKIGLMIVALTIMTAAGFLFLYYKSELDVKQTANEVGIIRGILMEKMRLEQFIKKGPNEKETLEENVQVLDFATARSEEITLRLGEKVKVAYLDHEEEFLLIRIDGNKAVLSIRYGGRATLMDVEEGVMRQAVLATVTGRLVDEKHGLVKIVMSDEINTN